MFYTHAILSKKGPLAKLWLAAHWDRKLTKTQVFETNIENCCESILQPRIKLALRTKGHLLLGVVRIYSRKVKYLLADCNEAFIKIKMAFRPGAEAELLAEESRDIAASGALTLQENIQDLDNLIMMDLDFDITRLQEQFRQNQARMEEITMKEDEMEFSFPVDDDFGESKLIEKLRNAGPSSSISLISHPDVNFLDDKMQKSSDQTSTLIEGMPSDVLNDSSMQNGIVDALSEMPNLTVPLSVDPPPLFEETLLPPERSPADFTTSKTDAEDGAFQQEITTTTGDQVTLLKNENEAFVLEPIVIDVPERKTWARRKRRLIVDEIKEIDSASMKEQLSDASDTLGILEMAPPTRRLMKWKETGAAEKLYALNCCQLTSKYFSNIVFDNAILRRIRSSGGEQPAVPEQPNQSAVTKVDAAERDSQRRSSKRDKRESLAPKRSKDVPTLNGVEMPSDFHAELNQPPQEFPSSTEFPQQSSMLVDSSVAHLSTTDPLVVNNVSSSVLQTAELAPADVIPDDVSTEIRRIFEERTDTDFHDGGTPSFLNGIKFALRHVKSMHFSQFIKATQMNRKEVATCFFDLLELKRSSVIDFKQEETYGEILIVRGPAFSSSQ